MYTRYLVAGLAGGLTGLMTLLFGGSYVLALILAGVVGLLTALGRDAIVLMGWERK